ncbi:hypothetical protein [uncultured Exiguobacterium sp.]|uniref:hypothetical protein n=1 Tax=uncultured Exiguobacterium sp. TaxID=202669 RepID=UPI0037481269
MRKIDKKFAKAMKLSVDGNKGVSAVALDSNPAVITGMGQFPISPQTAILYVTLREESQMIGHIGKSVLNASTENPVIIAIDNRDVSNPVLYLSSNELIKIDNQTVIEPDDKIFLYWEYGHYSLLVFMGHEPISDETVIQCSFCKKEENLKDNRFLFLSLLPEENRDVFIREFKKQDLYHLDKTKGQLNE